MSTQASTVSGIAPRAPQRALEWVRQNRSKVALLGVILALTAVTASQSDIFLTWSNIKNVMIQSSVIGILAVGTTLLMVSGGIDLSIGSGVSLGGVVMASLMVDGWSPVTAIAVAVLILIALGLITGGLAAWSPTHPFVVTLGMLTLVHGIALLVSEGPVTGITESFISIASREVLGLPVVVIVFAATALIGHLILSTTKLGRWLYAIGASQDAAYLAGIPIKRIKILTYGVSGALVAVAAVMLTSQLASAQPQMGQGLELSAIAAVAVGGTPLAGGRGDIAGTLLGVLLLGLIGNALNLLAIGSEWQYVLQGAVIIVAVMAQRGSS